jgi:RimJ/RimL family protein N-acetyltransferase
MQLVLLREVTDGDLPVLYEHQLDSDATQMAAFPSRDWDAFTAHWAKIMTSTTGVVRTVVCDDGIAGHVGCWEQAGETLVGYWIGREYWGKGVATAALAQLVDIIPTRPLVAHVAKHNAGSIRVLEKCGFIHVGDEEFTAPDGAHITESIFKLDNGQ